MTGSTMCYVGTIERYTGSYSQSFTFDSQGLGNITNKTSTQTTTPDIAIGQNLRYSFGFSYSATKPHQPTQIGDIHYDYDDNGNLLAEYTQARDSGTVTAPPVTTDDTGMSSMPLGIGIAVTDPYSVNGYIRRFGWNEENQLVWSNDGKNVVTYRYGADGERTLKYRSSSESLYFDSMWTCQTDGSSLRESKHIFVGQTRIATRLSIRGHADNSYPLVNTYYYHGDHLGSAQTVTDYRGALYERLEYTPYGELWVEQKTDTDPVAKIPYRFTGKEYDTETGLYAFGARYLNPVTAMWISADPALLDGSFLPVAPTSDDARKKNSNLPGMGGVYNGLNFASYSYCKAKPVIYLDPDGKIDKHFREKALKLINEGRQEIAEGQETIGYGLALKGPQSNLADSFISSGLIQKLKGEEKLKKGQAALERTQLADSIGKGHAYDKHAQENGEFVKEGITGDGTVEDQERFVTFINTILEDPKAAHKTLANGREAYLDNKTGTVIILDPNNPDKGTAFKPGNTPSDAKKYYESSKLK